MRGGMSRSIAAVVSSGSQIVTSLLQSDTGLLGWLASVTTASIWGMST